jgi:hypothetical protein
VRSSSNDLFVEFPSYYDTNMGIEAFYASVKVINLTKKLIFIFILKILCLIILQKINGTDKPFVPGV